MTALDQARQASGEAAGAVAVMRRVVTGHDRLGRSVVLSDGPAPNTFTSDAVPGLQSAVAWTTAPGTPSNDGDHDTAAATAEIPMSPPAGGTIFRIADFPPDAVYRPLAADDLFEEIDGGRDAQLQDESGERHFWFHRTDSLDYGIVLSGEIVMLLDDGEVHLRAGDVVVQRGTGHSWSNRTDTVCRMAFVLIGAEPVAGTPEQPGHAGATAGA